MALVGLPSLEREFFKGSSDRLSSHEDVRESPKRHKRALADSTDSTQFVELDLIDDESEDEGEIMLLAMILLQIHGVKLSAASQSELDHNKKKRQRTSPEQLAILETIFQTDKMPSQQTRIHLADQLGMSSRRVQIWFQNKRAKVKRGLGKSSDDIGEPSSPLDEEDSPSPSRRNSTCLSLSTPSLTSLSSSICSLESPVPVSSNNHTLSSITLSNLSSLSQSISPLKQSQLVRPPMKETHDSYIDAIKV